MNLMQLIGNSLSRDLFSWDKKDGKVSEKRILAISRTFMFGVSVVILFVTLWQPPSVMWIGYFAATLFAASWGPVAFASIYSKSITKDAAFWSIILGFVGVIAGELLKLSGVSLPVYLHPAIIGILCSTFTLLLLSKESRVSEAERAFQEKIRRYPTYDGEERDLQATRRYPFVLMGSGVLLILLTFVFYYLPVS